MLAHWISNEARPNGAHADGEDGWMTSDRDDLNESDDLPVNDTGDAIENAAEFEPGVDSDGDSLIESIEATAQADEAMLREAGDAPATPPEYVLPADRPGASATTGTGTSIAVSCTAVMVVILLITILILTLVS